MLQALKDLNVSKVYRYGVQYTQAANAVETQMMIDGFYSFINHFHAIAYSRVTRKWYLILYSEKTEEMCAFDTSAVHEIIELPYTGNKADTGFLALNILALQE